MYRKLLIACLFLLTACGGYVERRINSGNDALNDAAYDRALRDYQNAQVAAPDHPAAYFNAASAYIGTGDEDMAIAALQQAIESEDSEISAKAFYNLGNIYYNAGEYNRAIDAYQQALLLNADDDDARHNLELALLRAVQATPTAQEQQTDPQNDDTNPEATPTDQPSGFDGPTPTPPPFDVDLTATSSAGQDNTDNTGTGTPKPQPDGEMTVEQAMQILDQIQQDQQALSEFLDRAGAPGAATDLDW